MNITQELQQGVRALRTLRAQRIHEIEKIDTSIRSMLNLLPDMPDVDSADTEVDDRFKGMSIPAAARTFLEERGGPAQTAEIADALLAGGITTTARNFSTTVYSILRESKGFVRVNGKGWSFRKPEVDVAASKELPATGPLL